MAGPLNEEAPVFLPVNALVSYHYFREIDIGHMARWGLCMVGDSGAFSAASQGAQIDQDEFYEWARLWRNDLLWTASLDVIGDEGRSWANWKRAPKDLGLIPTVHYGADPSSIDRYVEAGVDLIGLGGMVPYKSEPARLLRWCLQMMRYARDKHPHVRFHGWGVTHPDLVMNLPWWSVDSSGFSAAYRFGILTLVDPRTGKRILVKMNGKDAANHATLLRNAYGVDWRKVAVSNRETRRDVVRVAVHAMQHLERFLQRRWKVEPPQSLTSAARSSVDKGPIVHNVLGAPSMQPPKSLSPDDKGPRIHSVFGAYNKEAEYMIKEEA